MCQILLDFYPESRSFCVEQIKYYDNEGGQNVYLYIFSSFDSWKIQSTRVNGKHHRVIRLSPFICYPSDG